MSVQEKGSDREVPSFREYRAVLPMSVVQLIGSGDLHVADHPDTMAR